MGDDDLSYSDDRWVRPRPDGDFDLDLPSGIRAMVGEFVGNLEELLSSDSEVVRRIFPTAYPDDPEREAGYQALARAELIDRHNESARVITSTLARDRLTEEQLTSWMTALNAVRLVLGTALDVRDDEPFEVDMESEEGPAQLAYEVLNELLVEIVQALSTRL